MSNKFIESISPNPRVLFIVDAIGAAISAILLGIVLPKFQSTMGIPIVTLTFLASFPLLFFMFDLFAYKAETKNTGRNLFLIAALNIFYVLLSIFFIWIHQNEITTIGYVYFVGEIFIICALVYLQISTAKIISKS